MNWFKPTDNTIISFSGGRTSGMMLKLILDAFGGVLPDWVKVVFCNTGEECEETLDFVRDCSLNWNVPIIWLEYKTSEVPKERWHEVTYETASRNGEPFEALIKQKKYLPNPVKRFCTIELKILCAKRYAQSVLKWKHWDVAIGFRADEPSRTAKLSLPNKEPFERFAPLASMGITAKDVGEFWRNQGFDLALPNMNLQKNKPYRNRRLLNLAHRVNECMFKSPVCEGISPRGCESAHSDFQEHGKGLGQKASDDKACATCKSCHNWIGEKLVPREVLLGMFERGIERTMAYYRKMGWLVKVGYPDK